MGADKLASFRIDGGLWQQFQSVAKENGTNASALLVAYIKTVVNTGNVNTIGESVNTTVEIKKSSLSVQDIDDCIDKSVDSGKINQAIATSYENMMGNFNQLLEEVNNLKSQLLGDKSQESTPISNEQPLKQDDIVSILGIEDIVNGDSYSKDSIVNIKGKIIEHKQRLERELNIKLSLDNPVFIARELNKILRALGFELDSKQIGKNVNYWIKKSYHRDGKKPIKAIG